MARKQILCFCHNVETIDHLFFEYRFARIVWFVFHYVSNLAKPINASHLFGSWIQGLPSNWQHIALLGAAALCWSLWLGRNDLVFEKKDCSSPLQVIFAAVHWMRSWAILQRTDLQDLVMEASHHLARVAMDIFFRAHGWRSSLRIE